MTAFLMILGAFLVYALQKWIYAANWYKGLSADFEFLEDAVTEGDLTHMKETLANRKQLPLFTLQVKMAITPNFSFGEMENTITTDQNYRNDIYVLNGYERVTRTIPFTCLRRGFYTVSSLELISSDIFHTVKLARRIPQNEALYVYPSPVDQEGIDILYREMLGTMITRHYSLEDPFELRGIREYQSGDPMKNINWKVSAHREDWMVNQYQYTASQHVRILLDLGNDSNWKYEKLYEEAIRIASSLITACLGDRIPVSLKTNAFDIISGSPVDESAGSGPMHVETLMRALARIDETREAFPFREILESELHGGSSGITYVMISYSHNSHHLELFDELCHDAPGSRWISVQHPDMETGRTDFINVIPSVWEVPYE